VIPLLGVVARKKRDGVGNGLAGLIWVYFGVMLFLIEFDRSKQQLVTYKKFDKSQLLLVQKERINLELKRLKENVMHEIVILEAKDEEFLRKYYSRYFNPFKKKLVPK